MAHFNTLPPLSLTPSTSDEGTRFDREAAVKEIFARRAVSPEISRRSKAMGFCPAIRKCVTRPSRSANASFLQFRLLVEFSVKKNARSRTRSLKCISPSCDIARRKCPFSIDYASASTSGAAKGVTSAIRVSTVEIVRAKEDLTPFAIKARERTIGCTRVERV